MGSLPFQDDMWSGGSVAYIHTIEKKTPLITLSPLSVFQQRPTKRSPVESPPVNKKAALMKVTSPEALPDRTFPLSPERYENGGIYETGTLGRRQNPSPQGKENRSILKRNGTRGSYSDTTLGRNQRRVEFEPSVQVFHFDKVAGDHVGSENQKLTVEPKDRREFVNRTIQNKFRVVETPSTSTAASIERGGLVLNAVPASDTKITTRKSLFSGSSEPRLQYSNDQSQSSLHSVSQSQSSLHSVTSTPRPLPIPTSSSAASLPISEGFVPSAVDFTFFEDEGHRLRIKFTIPLGSGVSANDVLVKANMTGNKVRVVASRSLPRRDGGPPLREEFSERYLLPMEVDPYLITARLDGSGNLFVEAPIMSAKRKQELAVERQAKSSSSSTSTTSSSLSGFSL